MRRAISAAATWPYTFAVVLSMAVGATAVYYSQTLGVGLKDPEGFLGPAYVRLPLIGMLFFLAGLQNIPGALYEAADIDGATPWQKLMNVTVPMLRPVTFYVITVGLIGTMQMFDQVAVIGSAAPGDTLITLAYYVYTNTFKAGAAPVNLASAAAIILAAIILVMVFVQRKFFPSEAV